MKNKPLKITSIILLCIALIVFLLGVWLSGWDFIKFFHSSTFTWICVLLGLYVLGATAILIIDRINKL